MVKYIDDEVHVENAWDLEQEMCKYDCKTKEELGELLWRDYGVALILDYKEDNSMKTITVYKNATEAFEYLYNYIMSCGKPTKIGTKAIYNTGFYLINPKQRNITTEWRKFSEKYAEREFAWYLSGNRSVEEIKKYAPIWDKMHGGDNIVNSNYGWQWQRNGQLAKCIEQLKDNKNTRRAWLTIFDGKEKDDYTYDTPCTLSIGFDIKPGIGTLDMCVTMRSNDLVYGFCNDQYCFTKLQELVADELGLPVGTYYHFAHDLHIYERHFNMKENYESKATAGNP